MQCATTAAANLTLDVEQNVLARQMFGQRLASRSRFERVCYNRRVALTDAGDVALELFQGERELINIKAFGTAAELAPLKLLDDELKALDFTVATLNSGGDVAYQTMQKRCIDGRLSRSSCMSDFTRTR